MCLEINVLIFIPLIFKKSGKYQREVAIKYFIIQAIASIIIITRLSQIFLPLINYIFLSAALLLKIGAAPLHRWIPALVEGLSWKNFFLFITTQKIRPIIVLSINLANQLIINIFYVFILAGSIIGRISGLAQSSFRKILTFSSINHIRWILTALLVRKGLWIFYFFIYSCLILSIIKSLYKRNLNKLSGIFKKPSNRDISTSINFLSLGGLPPFTGFLPKFLVISKVFSNNISFILIPIIVGSLISLFFYLRISFQTFFLLKKSPIIINSRLYRKINISPALFNITGLFILLPIVHLLLDFKLIKL